MEKIFSMRRSYGNPQNQTVTVEVDKFNKLVECVYALADEVRGMRSLCQSSTVIYTNKTGSVRKSGCVPSYNPIKIIFLCHETMASVTHRIS